MVIFLLNFSILWALELLIINHFKTHRLSLTHQDVLVRNLDKSSNECCHLVISFFLKNDKYQVFITLYISLRNYMQYTCALDGRVQDVFELIEWQLSFGLCIVAFNCIYYSHIACCWTSCTHAFSSLSAQNLCIFCSNLF